MVMFICRGKRSRLQVALLIYGPNITFRSLDGGLGMSRLGLLRSCSLFLVSSFLNKSPLTLVGPHSGNGCLGGGSRLGFLAQPRLSLKAGPRRSRLMRLLMLLGCLTLLNGQTGGSHCVEITAWAVSHKMSVALTFVALWWALLVPRSTPINGGGAFSVAFDCLVSTLVGDVLGNTPHPLWLWSGWASLWVPALPEFGP